MPSKHMVTGSNPVGETKYAVWLYSSHHKRSEEVLRLLVPTRMSTELDPKGGGNGYPPHTEFRKYDRVV